MKGSVKFWLAATIYGVYHVASGDYPLPIKMLLAFGVLMVWILVEAHAADVRDREHTTWAQYTPGVLVVRAVRALNRLLDRVFFL